MVTSKKIEFFVKQGYNKSDIDFLIECGVDKHLISFLNMFKMGYVNSSDKENIKSINNYLINGAGRTITLITEDLFNQNQKKHLTSSKSSSLKQAPHGRDAYVYGAYKPKRITYKQLLNEAISYSKNEIRKANNIIYKLQNNYYISIIEPQDCYEEGTSMSNCIVDYDYKISPKGNIGILALKKPNGKTVVHIEIKRNGVIGQNFCKSNKQITIEYWNMIIEFFENNCKELDLDKKAFGEYYRFYCGGNSLGEVSVGIPTGITQIMTNGKTEIQLHDFISIKNIIPCEILKNIITKDKIEIVTALKKHKEEINQKVDDMIERLLITSASKLYLSDNIKEKIFGHSYTMKGNDYNFSEINYDYGNDGNKSKCVHIDAPVGHGIPNVEMYDGMAEEEHAVQYFDKEPEPESIYEETTLTEFELIIDDGINDYDDVLVGNKGEHHNKLNFTENMATAQYGRKEFEFDFAVR
jgi:hypothetical protein